MVAEMGWTASESRKQSQECWQLGDREANSSRSIVNVGSISVGVECGKGRSSRWQGRLFACWRAGPIADYCPHGPVFGAVACDWLIFESAIDDVLVTSVVALVALVALPSASSLPSTPVRGVAAPRPCGVSVRQLAARTKPRLCRRFPRPTVENTFIHLPCPVVLASKFAHALAR